MQFKNVEYLVGDEIKTGKFIVLKTVADVEEYSKKFFEELGDKISSIKGKIALALNTEENFYNHLMSEGASKEDIQSKFSSIKLQAFINEISTGNIILVNENGGYQTTSKCNEL